MAEVRLDHFQPTTVWCYDNRWARDGKSTRPAEIFADDATQALSDEAFVLTTKGISALADALEVPKPL